MSYYGSFVLQCYVLRMRVMTSPVGGNLTNRPPALRHIHVNTATVFNKYLLTFLFFVEETLFLYCNRKSPYVNSPRHAVGSILTSFRNFDLRLGVQYISCSLRRGVPVMNRRLSGGGLV